MYKPESRIAEEFISHSEILETLEYARENKNNRPLIESLIEKAALCKGLSHREAFCLPLSSFLPGRLRVSSWRFERKCTKVICVQSRFCI